MTAEDAMTDDVSDPQREVLVAVWRALRAIDERLGIEGAPVTPRAREILAALSAAGFAVVPAALVTEFRELARSILRRNGIDPDDDKAVRAAARREG